MYPQANANMMFGGPSSSANQARLVSKQAELEGLRALKDQSAKMVKELERLAETVDQMADGGDCKCMPVSRREVDGILLTMWCRIAIASVMGSWQGVFRAIQIARGKHKEPI